MTVATTDGDTTWAFRYSSEGRSRSLFHSTDVATLRVQYPDNPMLHDLADNARLVVSEPLGDLRGAWREVPGVHLRGGARRRGRPVPVHADRPLVPAAVPPSGSAAGAAAVQHRLARR